jgi:uncharacterized OsmC-like protein
MNDLLDYLVAKRQAIRVRREAAKTQTLEPRTLTARATAEGRSGVRRIRIRDFQVISDSGPDFAGYNLGPSSPELQLGTLSSCITHVFLIQAADLGVPLESLEVEVTGTMDPRAGRDGFEDTPVYPHGITYDVYLSSSASSEELAALHAAVEKACPILNLLINPQKITGRVIQTSPAELEKEAIAV